MLLWQLTIPDVGLLCLRLNCNYLIMQLQHQAPSWYYLTLQCHLVQWCHCQQIWLDHSGLGRVLGSRSEHMSSEVKFNSTWFNVQSLWWPTSVMAKAKAIWQKQKPYVKSKSHTAKAKLYSISKSVRAKAKDLRQKQKCHYIKAKADESWWSMG